MRKLLACLLILSFFAQGALAQEESSEEYEGFAEEVQPTNSRPRSSVSLGVSSLQWNDTLRLQQGAVIEREYANYNGLTFTIQKEKTYLQWGWALGAFFGAGKAIGGGNSSSITYQQRDVGFTVFGVSPRLFYNLSGRINTGFTAMAFLRNIDWPAGSGSLTIDKGRTINIAGLLDLNVRLTKKWDFYTGIGPLAEGATLWKIGAHFNF